MSKKQTKALDSIAPNPANPRTITGERAQKLAEYLDEFGDLSGIVHNTRKGFDVLISGHQRMEVFRGGGGDLVITEDFSPPQPDGTIARGYIEMDGKRYQYRRVDWPKEKADRATLVANGTFGEWDADKLSEWGYEPEQLEEMGVWLADDSEEGEGGVPNNALNSEKVEEDDFEAPEIETVQTDIVLGDLLEIGPHRLLCGDSTKAEDVDRLMWGRKADIMVTDPPYGIGLDTDYSKMGSTTTKYEKISGDEKEFDLRDVLAIADVKEKYIWGGDYLVNSLDWMSGTQLIWAKRHSEEENKVFGSAFESLWVSYKCKKAIWFIRPINQSSERLGKHPTQKPVECMGRCISMSKLNGHIYDAFLGSGTTMVAAHQLNRVCYGLELEPKYCDVIVRRMLKLDNTLTVKRNGVDETAKWLNS